MRHHSSKHKGIILWAGNLEWTQDYRVYLFITFIYLYLRSGERLTSTISVLTLPGSPFRVPVKDVVDPGKVKCSGPGLGTGVRARVPQTFTVDCSQAGRAPLQVAVLGPTGMECLE